jgi:hypothetical protein
LIAFGYEHWRSKALIFINTSAVLTLRERPLC